MPPSRNDSELRALLKLAGPLVLAAAGLQLMALVDTAVLGRVSDVALGAVGLGNGLFFTPSVLGLGLMTGLDPLVSQALGAGDDERARAWLVQGTWLALAATLVLLPPLFLLPALLEPAGVSQGVAEQARLFFRLRLMALFPMLLFAVARSYLQALGRTLPLLVATLAANAVNLLADLLLVFGGATLPLWAGPLRYVPALGVRGAGIATALSTFALCGGVWVSVLRVHPIRWRPPSVRALREALQVGIPVGLQMAAEVGIFALAGVVVGRLGTVSLAAHQVSLTLASFTFMGAYGFAGASSVRVGLQVGARNNVAARRAGLLGMALGGGWMTLCALALVTFPALFAHLLTDQADVLALALPLLRVVAAFQLSDGLQAVSTGALRGAGDTRFPFLANLTGHYLFGLPLGLWLAMSWGLGVVGIWWGLALGLTLVAMALVARFLALSGRPIRPLDSV